MASKLLAGSLMLLPAFALDTYYGYSGLFVDKYQARTEDESLVESAKNTGKRWAKMAGVLGIAGVSYVGLFHVMIGGYELTPQICPRAMPE